MIYTPSQGLAHPASRREEPNSPLASELLARRADAKMASLNAQWAAELIGPTVQLTLSAPITGMAANTDNVVLMTTIAKQVGGTFNSQTLFAGGGAGWYHCWLSTEAQCSGAINTGTRRRLRVDIQGSDAPYQQTLVTESWISEETQGASGVVNHHLEFVTFLRPSYNILAWYLHGNTSSNMQINTTQTQWSMTKICPEV